MRFFPALLFTLFLPGCAAIFPEAIPASTAANPVLQLTFQEGQTVTVQLDTTPQLQAAVLSWAQSGVYTATPVYRNRPGVFVLTGKPRLAGKPFVAGVPLPQENEQTIFTTSTLGLVLHADGTVGPELYLRYGLCPEINCEAPASVTIGRIVEGRHTLTGVLRGDRLEGITLRP